jgi:hypothetical protein
MGFSVKPSLSLGSFDFFNPSVTASYGGQTFQILGGYSFRDVGSLTRMAPATPLPITPTTAPAGKQQRAFDINTGWFEARLRLSERQQISLAYTRQQAGLILYPYLTMDSDHDNADRATFKYSAHDLDTHAAQSPRRELLHPGQALHVRRPAHLGHDGELVDGR